MVGDDEMSIVLRRHIPVIIVTIIGIFLFFTYPIDNPVVIGTAGILGNWAMILASFALGIGAINMIVIHGRRVSEMRKGLWEPSLALLITMAAVLLLGLATSVKSDEYTLVYDTLVGAGRLTLVSLRGFFMFSAFYRAYRARALDGTVMLIVSILLMMYNVPIAELFFPQLNVFTQWLLDVLFVGGERGLRIIGGIGMIIITFRILTTADRSWMGREE